MRARLGADAERVSYSQQAVLANNIIFFVTNWIYFSFLHCPKLITRKQSTCAPTAPPAGCASYLVSPPSSQHVFGWLLCNFLSFGGRRRICCNCWGCRRPCRTLCRHLCCPCHCHHTPLMSLHGCVAYPIPPLSSPRVFGWLSREKIERLVKDVAVLAVLVAVIFVALVVAIALPKRSCMVVWPMPSPSVTPACFWLVVVCKISNGGHLRPLSDFISVIFFVVQFAAPQKEKHPPRYSTLVAHALHHPSYHCCQLLVNCCV
jgi:hypothetical protein